MGIKKAEIVHVLLGCDIYIDAIWWHEVILILADIKSLVKH